MFKKFCIVVFIVSLLGQITWADQSSALVTGCNGCHAKAALQGDPSIPNISGQHFFYLYTQLKDYKAGRRSHNVMSTIAQQLTKAEMKALAMHYAEKPWDKVTAEIDGSNDSRASEILEAGGRNSCLKCHSNLIGLNGTPRLAGQKASYLRATMLAFKNKTRLNAATKNTLFKDVADSDIDALASYISSQ